MPVRLPMGRRHGVRILALWFLALLAYSNSFAGGLVFDNAPIVGRDPRIREVTADNLRLIFTQGYWYGRDAANLYRPLTTLSYLGNYAILGGGSNPVSYHWVNFWLHAINILLVYLLLVELLGEAIAAFAAAAIWAVHPVLTESVTNIVGRADLLAACGVLAGLLCYTRATRRDARRKRLWLAGLSLAALAGIFSKESAVVLIAAMALYDLTFGDGRWRDRAAGYAAAGLPILLYLGARARVFAGLAQEPIPFVDNPLTGAGFWLGRLTAVKVLGKYLLLLIWPRRLSNDYSYNEIPLSQWSDWRALAALAVCAGAVAIAVICRRRARAESYFLAFFFLALAPTANLAIQIGTIMAERFLYLPAISIAVVAELAWRRFAVKLPRRAGGIALMLASAILAARTWARNSDWADSETLWTSAAESAPGSYKPHANLGNLLADRGQLEPARVEAERALAIVAPLAGDRNPAGPDALAARCYRLEGDAAADPAVKDGWYRKAVNLLLLREERDRNLSRKLGHPEGLTETYLELGRMYQRLGQPREATEALEYGRRVAPDEFLCEELADLYQRDGELERAAIGYFEALSLNPERMDAASKLVAVYRSLDPRGCSIANGSLNLDCPLVHGDLCTSAGNLARINRSAGHSLTAEAIESQARRNFGCPAGQAR